MLSVEISSDISPDEALKLAFRPDRQPGFNVSQRRHLLSGSSGPYTPQQLQQAYLGGKAPSQCQPIAIVDAYATPNAQSDLNKYRSSFGLPGMTIQQFDQNGSPLQTSNSRAAGYVPYNAGWAGEQMLDLSMASAMCPCCPLIYVGASSSSGSDLNAAVATAVRKGAKVVSMSWGSNEGAGAANDASLYNIPGVVFTASTGDNGYPGGVLYPASSLYVTAVGGTSLHLDSNGNRASETAWSGAGSGCSAYVRKPSWQADPACPRRTVADVSAVAGEGSIACNHCMVCVKWSVRWQVSVKCCLPLSWT